MKESFYSTRKKMIKKVLYSFVCEYCGTYSGEKIAEYEQVEFDNRKTNNYTQSDLSALETRCYAKLMEQLKADRIQIETTGIYPERFVCKCTQCGHGQSWGKMRFRKKIGNSAIIGALVGLLLTRSIGYLVIQLYSLYLGIAIVVLGVALFACLGAGLSFAKRNVIIGTVAKTNEPQTPQILWSNEA